ncbi:activator of basal transcription 1 [Motacilla alba alba]|uniref:activator of basal transcription 1 n=1 Tax=Motacilla alba alba TaxID=1094192 RepID=UPI0018D57094|nr:activator of basal transcription 1 [Motacilla alba alba]
MAGAERDPHGRGEEEEEEEEEEKEEEEEEEEEKEEEEEEEEEKEEEEEGPECSPAAEAPSDPPPKPVVPGVLYLSFLPPGFGPRQARALLRPHGELGRVFLQPRGGSVRRRRQRPGGPPAVAFAEGWVEFRDKRAAKRAAKILHGAPMAPRPRSPFRHHCWSIKYLPGFRWPHLSERLSYERQVRAQRLRAEVAQAKREGGFYARRASKEPPKTSGDPAAPSPTWGFAQRPTEEEIWRRKARPPPAAPPQRLLEKVFGTGR